MAGAKNSPKTSCCPGSGKPVRNGRSARRLAKTSVEVEGENASLFDSEFVRHAANAVFHYFRYELGRQAVTVAEFASALEKVLSGFALRTAASTESQRSLAVLESDLGRLAEQ